MLLHHLLDHWREHGAQVCDEDFSIVACQQQLPILRDCHLGHRRTILAIGTIDAVKTILSSLREHASLVFDLDERATSIDEEVPVFIVDTIFLEPTPPEA